MSEYLFYLAEMFDIYTVQWRIQKSLFLLFSFFLSFFLFFFLSFFFFFFFWGVGGGADKCPLMERWDSFLYISQKRGAWAPALSLKKNLLGFNVHIQNKLV